MVALTPRPPTPLHPCLWQDLGLRLPAQRLLAGAVGRGVGAAADHAAGGEAAGDGAGNGAGDSCQPALALARVFCRPPDAALLPSPAALPLPALCVCTVFHQLTTHSAMPPRAHSSPSPTPRDSAAQTSPRAPHALTQHYTSTRPSPAVLPLPLLCLARAGPPLVRALPLQQRHAAPAGPRAAVLLHCWQPTLCLCPARPLQQRRAAPAGGCGCAMHWQVRTAALPPTQRRKPDPSLRASAARALPRSSTRVPGRPCSWCCQLCCSGEQAGGAQALQQLWRDATSPVLCCCCRCCYCCR